MTQNLSEFLREKKKRTDEETRGIDWNQRRQEWLDAVAQLYLIVEGFLSDPTKDGSVSTARRAKQLTESHLGTYSIEDMVLTIGDEEVIFSPKGRNIIGAQGRVDVRGETGEAMLVVQPGPRWSVVQSKVPQLKLVPFDSEAFAEMLHDITRR